METTDIAGYILTVLCVLLWIADVYLSVKLKSHLTPKDRNNRTRYNEEYEED